MLSLHLPSQKVGQQCPSEVHGVRLSPQMGSGEAEEALSCREHWEVFQSTIVQVSITWRALCCCRLLWWDKTRNISISEGVILTRQQLWISLASKSGKGSHLYSSFLFPSLLVLLLVGFLQITFPPIIPTESSTGQSSVFPRTPFLLGFNTKDSESLGPVKPREEPILCSPSSWETFAESGVALCACKSACVKLKEEDGGSQASQDCVLWSRAPNQPQQTQRLPRAPFNVGQKKRREKGRRLMDQGHRTDSGVKL